MKRFFAEWLELHPKWQRHEMWNKILRIVALALPILVIWIAIIFYHLNGGR